MFRKCLETPIMVCKTVYPGSIPGVASRHPAEIVRLTRAAPASLGQRNLPPGLGAFSNTKAKPREIVWMSERGRDLRAVFAFRRLDG